MNTSNTKEKDVGKKIFNNLVLKKTIHEKETTDYYSCVNF